MFAAAGVHLFSPLPFISSNRFRLHGFATGGSLLEQAPCMLRETAFCIPVLILLILCFAVMILNFSTYTLVLLSEMKNPSVSFLYLSFVAQQPMSSQPAIMHVVPFVYSYLISSVALQVPSPASHMARMLRNNFAWSYGIGLAVNVGVGRLEFNYCFPQPGAGPSR